MPFAVNIARLRGRVSRIVLTGLATLLVSAGTWQVGSGAWIYAKAAVARVLLDRSWAASIRGQRPLRPWPGAHVTTVARLRVERLGVDQVLLSGMGGQALAFGPGLVTLPSQAGQRVLLAAGHRDTHFSWLRALQRGDDLLLELPDERRVTYRVDSMAVVDSREAPVVSLAASSTSAGASATGPDTTTPDTTTPDTLLLSTCYPFDALQAGGPMRLLLRASRLSST